VILVGGSHFKDILHSIDMYPAILEVLARIGKDHPQKNDWTRICGVCTAFE
jgi:hypothetical protein